MNNMLFDQQVMISGRDTNASVDTPGLHSPRKLRPETFQTPAKASATLFKHKAPSDPISATLPVLLAKTTANSLKVKTAALLACVHADDSEREEHPLYEVLVV
jgi:hypothetical protein